MNEWLVNECLKCYVESAMKVKRREWLTPSMDYRVGDVWTVCDRVNRRAKRVSKLRRQHRRFQVEKTTCAKAWWCFLKKNKRMRHTQEWKAGCIWLAQHVCVAEWWEMSWIESLRVMHLNWTFRKCALIRVWRMDQNEESQKSEVN